MSIVVWTAISKVGRAGHLGSKLPRVNVPRNFGTTSGRPWVLAFYALESWAVVLALVPALIILVLFVFDHNVSSIMAQSKEFKLQKGSAYHLDFFVLGICIIVTGVLGIPPCNGLIPQAPLHTKSLGVLRTERLPDGRVVEVVEKTWEQRYTNFGQAVLTGVVLIRPLITVLGTIPNAALHGLFIFMALESLPGNELWERVCLLVSEPRLRRSDRAWYSLDFPVIARFTRLQFALAVVIFFVTEVPVIGMTFPLFIAALVFVRTKYLPKKYDARTLELIDPLIDLAPIDKTPSTADLLEEGTPPSSPAPQVVSSPVVRNRGGSA